MVKLLASLLSVFALLQIITASEVFVTEPEDVYVPEGSPAAVTFSCKVDSSNPVYTWMKDKKTIDLSANSRLKQFGGTLQISTPQQSDAGSYRCVSTSSEGKVVSNSANLIFQSLGQFPTTTPSTVKVVQGDGAQIACPQINFTPEDSVALYWEKKNDFEMINRPGGKNRYISWSGTLYFASVSMSDEDSYYCRARSLWDDEAGKPEERQSEATALDVSRAIVSSVAPKIVLQPESTTYAKLGGYMLLECYAFGTPVPEITWTKDGVSVPISKLTDAKQVFIRDVTQDDEGTYECTATNSQGSVKTNTNVQLQYAPEITQHLVAQNLELSSTATLSCGYTAQPAPSAITWIKDATVLSATSRLSIDSSSTSSQLQIQNLSEEDSGIYQCLVENALGDVLSSAMIEVTALAPTFVTDMPDLQKIASNNQAEIVCDLAASPPAQVTWTKDEFDVIQPYGDEGFTLNGYNLVIDNVSSSDEGEYKCSATNLAGSIEGTTYVQVFEPTVITDFTGSGDVIEIVAKDTVMLDCKATFDSNLEMDWRWTFNGDVMEDQIEEGDQVKIMIQAGALTLMDASSENSGDYQCCAITDVGTACATMPLLVNGPPGAVTSLSIQVPSDGTKLSLSWQEPALNGAPISEYTVDYCKVGSDGTCSSSAGFIPATTHPAYLNVTSCHVINLLPYNYYIFRITSSNKYGESVASLSTLPKRTSASAPIIAPSKVGGGGGFVGQLVVSWEALPRSYYGDDDVDYEVYVRRQAQGNDTNDWIVQVVLGGSGNEAIFRVSNEEIYTAYDVQVRATNSYGKGPFSDISVAHTAELAPTEAPTGFKPNGIKSYSANIKWNKIQDLNGFTQGYHVAVCDLFSYKNCRDSTTWTMIKTTDPDPHVLITDLEPNKPYSISVAAYNSAGPGPYSNFTFSFVTSKIPPQTAPHNAKYSLRGQKVSASWDPVYEEDGEGEVKGYVIQYWLAGRQTIADATEVYAGMNTQKNFNLPGQDDYAVCVSAYSNGGNGKPSSVVVISTDAGVSSKQTGGNGSSNLAPSSLITILSATIMAFFMKLLR